MRGHVARELLVPFVVGTAIGAPLGALVVTDLPTDLLRLILGLFVLWSVWAPKPRVAHVPPCAFLAVGAVTSFVTMSLGATGPFIAAFLNPERLGRHGTVATHAACMTAQYGLKVAAFKALGFLGTVVGRGFLDRLPKAAFARGFRLVLTLLALKLLWAGSAPLRA
jgi:uncharacterized protein